MAATELNQKCLKAPEIAFQEPVIIETGSTKRY